MVFRDLPIYLLGDLKEIVKTLKMKVHFDFLQFFHMIL